MICGQVLWLAIANWLGIGDYLFSTRQNARELFRPHGRQDLTILATE